MSEISPVIQQRPEQYKATMVEEGAKLGATIYGGLGIAGGALIGLNSKTIMDGAVAGLGAYGKVAAVATGAVVCGVAGVALGGIIGVINGASANYGTAVTRRSNEEFKNAGAIGAAAGGAALGLFGGLFTSRAGGGLRGMAVGSVASYFVGREIADRTLDKGI